MGFVPASPASLDMIRRLIAFDTVSRNSNLELIEEVRGYLTGLGIESELAYDETGGKANLYATLGPTDRPGIALSGHTDVVPIDGQDWSSDPFSVVERDGLLFGRGTSDMKSFIAVALALAPEFLARPIETPLHLCLSYDEEVGCLGVHGLMHLLESKAVRPRMCIVGEPTEMQVISGHKGKLSYRCHVRGHEAHSSLAHMGVNAVEAAAETIAHMKSMARRHRDHGPHDHDYSPPYTTIHTGVVQGGTALNIVPKDCWFDFEFRHLPQDDPHALLAEVQQFVTEKVEPEMHAFSTATGFTWERRSQIPGLAAAEDDEVVQLVKALTGRNSTGKVAFGTEAGIFQEGGIPTVICGPGSIEQAHKPDEFIALSQIEECETFMRRLFQRCWSEA
ncbi:MAG: acetylornithine deacetylase [Ectothiorhodospiraceae bacterium]|nr:acetylornithine deacetylase [Chromatiales bacterium]MCP5154625.1 acetylornithine deacetylase [Ectothiorhodospiraceae bacterium]